MPRKARIQYPGAIYHVMSRGDRRENIFLDDAARYDFLKTLSEACLKTSWRVHAYCLMGNHFHLVVETPKAMKRGQLEHFTWLHDPGTIASVRAQEDPHRYPGAIYHIISRGQSSRQ